MNAWRCKDIELKCHRLIGPGWRFGPILLPSAKAWLRWTEAQTGTPLVVTPLWSRDLSRSLKAPSKVLSTSYPVRYIYRYIYIYILYTYMNYIYSYLFISLLIFHFSNRVFSSSSLQDRLLDQAPSARAVVERPSRLPGLLLVITTSRAPLGHHRLSI